MLSSYVVQWLRCIDLFAFKLGISGKFISEKFYRFQVILLESCSVYNLI